MTPRSIRRAAERKAQKLARKQGLPQQPTAASPAQVAANRVNAQLSTGPRTEAGKLRSSSNALKTGLTGRTVLLPGDDADAYAEHIHYLFDAYQPVGLQEESLVMAIADTEWRLRRVPLLELAIYARGRDEFEEKFASQPNPVRRAFLLELETLLIYEKPLRNLHLQESRLRRAREKDIAELQALQAERLACETAEAESESELASNFQTPTLNPAPLPELASNFQTPPLLADTLPSDF